MTSRTKKMFLHILSEFRKADMHKQNFLSGNLVGKGQKVQLVGTYLSSLGA